MREIQAQGIPFMRESWFSGYPVYAGKDSLVHSLLWMKFGRAPSGRTL